jgi:threonine/homoserine/homoserine lactone efflux protein
MLLAAVNLLAAVILLYVGVKMLKNSKENVPHEAGKRKKFI